MDVFIEYLLVYLFGTFKFILGPTTGVAAGLNLHLTVFFTAFGMLTTAVLFSFFGEYVNAFIRRFFPKKKGRVFSKRNRRFVRIWGKYGVAGVAFLTPIILTPIVGAILANAFGGDRRKIVVYMGLSGIFWAYILTFILKYFKHLVF